MEQMTPQFDIPKEVGTDKTVGDKIQGIITYEVIEKDQQGIRIRINGLMLHEKRRI